MTIFFHELKRAKLSFCIWTGAIGGMVLLCMFLYPEMKAQMEDVNQIFANMGGFTSAFGMDQVNFAEIMGFYAIECGNILGIGGGFFAALLGITALSKEEKERTAEFLLTHPVSRSSVIAQKWLAGAAQILALNLALAGISWICFLCIGEEMDTKAFLLLHAAFLLLQEEIMSICFGVSAFLRNSGTGLGIGIAAVFYFLNLAANISEKAEFLCYLTPFAYADASDIVANGVINRSFLYPGMLYLLVGTGIAFWQYGRKDIFV